MASWRVAADDAVPYPDSVRRRPRFELHLVEVVEHSRVFESGFVECRTMEAPILGPNQRFPVTLGPFPLGERQPPPKRRVVQFVGIPIAACADRVINVGVRVLSQNPPLWKRLLKHIHPLAYSRPCRFPPRPSIAQEARIVHAQTLAPIAALGTKLLVAPHFRAVVQCEVATAVVEPVAILGSEQAAAIPAIAFAKQRNRLQPRGA